MGCDIHTITEVKTLDGWKAVQLNPPAFDCRSYGIFGFLADVRNYSRVPCPWPRREWPSDVSDEAKEIEEYWGGDGHSYHWLTIAELNNHDYDQTFEDRRVCRTIGNVTDGAALAEPGEGNRRTLREFLGGFFFDELARLSALGNEVRVLMCFDN